MNKSSIAEKTVKRYDRQLSLLIVAVVFIRRWIKYQDSRLEIFNVVILIIFFISYLIFPWLRNKSKRIFGLYIVSQILLAETLGFFDPAEDTWGLLFFPVWSGLRSMYSARKAYLLILGLGLLMTATLMIQFDWLIGLGYGVFMVAAGFLLLSPDIVYEQSENARRESQRLLTELKNAHRKLSRASRQAEELVEIRERDRMANELHDSVSQLMFSIKLLAQSTRLLMDKDPALVPSRLEQLQELTNRALTQMRSLITQWRGDA